MHMLMVLEDFTHQLVGRAFFRADVLRCRDNELHLQAFAQFKQRGDGASIQTCRFVEEQQTAWRNVFAAQATGFIFPALHDHHQDRHPRTDRLTGRKRAAFCAQPAVGATVNLNFHLQIITVVEQLFADGLRGTLAHVDLRVQALPEFRQRF